MRATATASANIALVKYWGKRDAELNLPAAGSLSVTLDALRTWTRVEPDPQLAADELRLDGAPATGRALDRVTRFLDLVRAPGAPRARVHSANDFPSAAGLASSASGFAALAVAATRAYGVEASDAALSVLARRGSGSAARSIFGGYAIMDAGRAEDGRDAHARSLDVDLPLAAAIAAVRAGPKAIGSTDGMESTRETSPYHGAWIRCVERDLELLQPMLQKGDWGQIATIVEGSCLAMHANAMAARPGIIYFQAATLWAIERVRGLRASGTPVFFTIDAGPHLVAFTAPEHLAAVAAALGEHPDVARVITSGMGGPARIVDEVPAEITL